MKQTYRSSSWQAPSPDCRPTRSWLSPKVRATFSNTVSRNHETGPSQGLVALDQRKRDQGGHNQGPSVDEALGIGGMQLASCAAAAARLLPRKFDSARRSGSTPSALPPQAAAARAGNGHLQLWRLERDRRPVGETRTSHEETGLERDQRRRSPRTSRANCRSRRPAMELLAACGLKKGSQQVSRNGPTYYGDSAVIAFRTPADEMTMEQLKPKVTAIGGAIDAAALMDDDPGTSP